MIVRALFVSLAGVLLAQTPDLSPTLSSISYPTSPGTVLYGLQGTAGTASPMRSEDNGKTWVPLYVFEPGTSQNVIAIAVHPTDPAIVYVSVTMDRGGVWKSIDSGKTWTAANTGLPEGSAAVRNLTVATNAGQTLYVRVGEAIFRSTDGAFTWERMGELPSGISEIGIHTSAPARIVAMGPGGLMYRSDNEGKSWIPIAAIFQQPTRTARQIVIHPRISTNIFVVSVVSRGTTNSCESPGAAIFRSTDSGTTWAVIFNFDTCTMYNSVVVDPTSSNVYTSGFSVGGNLCRSTDGGGKFVCNSGSSAVAVDPRNGNVVAAGGRQISTNRGESFSATNATIKVSLGKPASPWTVELAEGNDAEPAFTVLIAEGFYRLPIRLSITADPAITLPGKTGQTTQPFEVVVSARDLPAGVYDAIVRVDSDYAFNGAIDIPLRVTVLPSTGTGPRLLFNSVPASFSPSPSASVLDSAGNLYFHRDNKFQRLATNGQITTVAGTGTRGDSPDGTSALQVNLGYVNAMTLDGQGNIYWSETTPDRVRYIRNGVVGTIADQNLTFGSFTIRFSSPQAVAFDTSGRLLIGTTLGLVRINVTTRQAELPYARGSTMMHFGAMLVASNGDIVILDSLYNHIYRLRGGQLQVVAGTGTGGFTNDGGTAATAQVNRPSAGTIGSNGTLYFVDSFNARIRAITPDGKIYTVAGGGSTPVFRAAVGMDARTVTLSSFLSSLHTLASGEILMLSGGNLFRLAKIKGDAPTLLPDSVRSAADGISPVAPGGLFVLSGTKLTIAAATAGESGWPLELSQTRVIINNRSVPLSFVADEQVGGQVPYEIAAGEAKVRVQTPGGVTDEMPFAVQATAPAVLVNGEGKPAILNADGTLNSPENPASRESTVTVILTGVGPIDPPIKTGVLAPADPLSVPVAPVVAKAGDIALENVSLTMMPGFVGVTQASVPLPVIEATELDLTFSIGDFVSTPVKLYLAP